MRIYVASSCKGVTMKCQYKIYQVRLASLEERTAAGLTRDTRIPVFAAQLQREGTVEIPGTQMHIVVIEAGTRQPMIGDTYTMTFEKDNV